MIHSFENTRFHKMKKIHSKQINVIGSMFSGSVFLNHAKPTVQQYQKFTNTEK